MFSKNLFQNPPAPCTPGYFWMLNDHMVAEELEEQLEEMAAQGAKSVCMHPLPREFRWNTQMSPEYLSEEYHELLPL